MTATALAFPSPTLKYRLPAPQGGGQQIPDSQLPAVAGTPASAETAMSPVHPDSALFWFGVIAAVSFGLMAVSTSVRVGKAGAGFHIGKA